ncbi:MAG: glycosyltransferase family 2 protein [Phycisphaerae bacterium]|nr:glycosyltransferase family 2 protein [Phycisphaerae bacterium]
MTQDTKLKVLVVVPAFNEAANLPYVVAAVRQHAPEWDIAVVDDGSTDGTAEVARSLAVILLRLPVNLGIGGAVQTGLIYGHRNGYDICLQVDGDGQHDPAESVRLVDKLLESGADAVVGSRFLTETGYQSTFARRLGIRILRSVLGWLTGEPITDPTSGQRALGRRAIALLAGDYPQEYPEPEVIYVLRKHGLRLIETPVKMKARRGGQSSIRVLHSVLYMIKVLLAIFIHATRSPVKGGSV